MSLPRFTWMACVAVAMIGCGERTSFVEIDKMTGADFPLSQINDGGTLRTMASIFAEGSLILDVQNDDANLPAQPDWTDAELHNGMFLSWKNPAFAETDNKWSAYIVVAAGVSATWGPGTLGVIFDVGAVDINGSPREGCVVFWGAHDGLSNHDEEIFLTAIHELNHVFNGHHQDWEGGSFDSNSTIEGYSFTDTVVWGISTPTENHLENHPEANVKPGVGGVNFMTVTTDHTANHQSTP